MLNTLTSVVIVDRSHSSGYRLRNSLLKSEVTAYVFDAFAPALALIQSKKVDVVVVEFDTDKATVDFCEAVKERHVPLVYSPPPIEPNDLRQYGFGVEFSEAAFPGILAHTVPAPSGEDVEETRR